LEEEEEEEAAAAAEEEQDPTVAAAKREVSMSARWFRCFCRNGRGGVLRRQSERERESERERAAAVSPLMGTPTHGQGAGCAGGGRRGVARGTAMQQLRIVTLGISGGRSLTRSSRDARRFPSPGL
jgi:hypothetical protein